MTSLEARREPVLEIVRELARTYQAFVHFDSAHLRQLGLTPSQADVVFTLGNTEGMTFRELGERTLITKGTLTGVVDRLERAGWVERRAHPSDRRCTIVTLTPGGDALFQRAFPAHVVYLKRQFADLGAAEHRRVVRSLRTLRALFPE